MCLQWHRQLSHNVYWSAQMVIYSAIIYLFNVLAGLWISRRIKKSQKTSFTIQITMNIHSNKKTRSTSTQRAQTSLAETDHYSHISHCKNVEPWWWKTTPPLPPPRPPNKQKNKQKKSFGSLPAPRSGYTTTIYHHYCGDFLLIYSL